MNRPLLQATLALTIAFLALAPPAPAGDGPFDLGLRADIGTGDGEPTNDVIGYSLFGHYRLNERWSVGFAVDHSPEFDFERTPDLLGIATPEVFDAKGTSTTLSAWIERVYRRPGGRLEWFWNVGAGVNSVDIDRLSGPRVGGGSFDIETDAGSELQAMFGGGVRRWFGASRGLEAGVHLDRHFADWQLTDRVSGATATIDDYSITTLNLGLLKRF